MEIKEIPEWYRLVGIYRRRLGRPSNSTDVSGGFGLKSERDQIHVMADL